MIDSHCHLDFKDFNGRREEAIDNALANGVHTIVNIGCDPESARRTVELADQYDCIYGAVGVHPHDAKRYNGKVERLLRDLAGHEKVKAIGEIGLDFYRDLSPRDLQRKVFRKQLELAIDLGLPVVIHTRESFRDTLDIVREYLPDLTGGVFHCFPGTVEDADEVIRLGFHISVGGIITFPKAKMARVAAEAELDKIMLETDAPYLTPVPYRGKPNEPAYVRYVAEKMAELRQMPISEIEKITDRTTRKFFGLVETFGG